MTSTPPAYTSAPPPAQKVYGAPGVASLPYNQRPLPPGWISQFDATHQAYFYVDERANPPTVTWEDPRPAYYMAQERGQYAPPPPGAQGRSPGYQTQSPQPQQQQQYQTQTINPDGTVTTVTSNQPIHITQASTPQPQQQQQQQPQQQQQQQQQRKGPGVGTAIVGAAVVSSLLRPRVVVAPRRRRF
ncbi:hypothetical protein BGZ74_007026 [Mortierella antarctica]|nr:hypothetical protein BGZ74_007026 [Mortierella antarctica]